MEQAPAPPANVAAPAARAQGRNLAPLLLIVAAGLLVRAIHFAAIRDTAFLYFPLAGQQSDMWGFWAWSGEILSGNLWGDPPWHPYFPWMAAIGTVDDWHRWWGGVLPFQQEPAYPYFIALLRYLGAGLAGINALQLAISSLAAVPIYFLSRRFTTECGALVAAALATFYGPFVFYSGTLLRDWLAVLLQPTLVLLTLRAVSASSRPLAWGVAGAAMGATLLVKFTTLLLVVGLAGWALLTVRAQRIALARRAALLALGLALGFAPLLVRNAVVGAPLLKVCNRPIEGFVMANVADADPVAPHTPSADMVGILRKADGSMTVAMLETFRTYHGDLARFVEKQWRRIRALADPFEIPNNLSYAYGQALSPVLRALPDWGWVAPLGVAGLLWFVLAAPRTYAPLLIYWVAMLVPAMAQFVFDRYRLDLLAPASICAGLVVARLQECVQQQRWKHFAVGIAAIAAIASLQRWVLPLDLIHRDAWAVVHPWDYERAVLMYRQTGNLQAASAEIARLRAQADPHPELRETIDREADALLGPLLLDSASYQLRAGDPAGARRQLDAAVRLIDASASDPGAQLDIARTAEDCGVAALARGRALRYLELSPRGDRADEARTLLARLDAARP